MARAIVTQTLRTLGYTVLEAKDGETAVRILSDPTTAVDLLFSDLRMPGMSGADLALEARSLRPGLPVVFMSGYADSMLDELDRSIPLLEKPFQLIDMVALLRRMLDVESGERDLPDSTND